MGPDFPHFGNSNLVQPPSGLWALLAQSYQKPAIQECTSKNVIGSSSMLRRDIGAHVRIIIWALLESVYKVKLTSLGLTRNSDL